MRSYRDPTAASSQGVTPEFRIPNPETRNPKPLEDNHGQPF